MTNDVEYVLKEEYDVVVKENIKLKQESDFLRSQLNKIYKCCQNINNYIKCS